jgi:tRNA dimethylallyltransferase
LGPTASGKTRWGISLAKKFKGEVICADSRTVYKYLNIATAKPKGRNCGTKEEKNLGCRKVEGIEHYLLDFIEPKKIYNVADFQRDANRAIKLISAKKKTLFIVGGSALYIYALTYGYNFIPATAEEQKKMRQIRRELGRMELEELVRLLKEISPRDYKIIDLNNKRRVERALEKVLILKKIKKSPRRKSPIPYSILKIGIERKRAQIYKRIECRTAEWLKEGLIREVRGLINKKISKSRIDEFGLGYREVLKYIKGKIKNEEELKTKINFCQHAYVRRQMTWFRRDKEINWCENLKNAQVIIKKFLST